MREHDGPGVGTRIAPAMTLIVLAPLVAEVLPGATRFGSLFVFPIEMLVWGGGALMIRAAVRHWRLGWRNMLLLALALALAEECLIQQTSFAPLVIQIKGQVYARAFGINYVYLLWALAYEVVLVVFVPVTLTELLFPNRRDRTWVSRTGLAILAVLFAVGALLAWYSWTRIARIKVFHLPAYGPPLTYAAVAAVTIATLIFVAIGPPRLAIASPGAALKPPAPWTLGVLSFAWGALWFAVCLLAFGIAPQVPPVVPMVGGVSILMGILVVLPRWCAHAAWSDARSYALVVGTTLGSMLITFVGFQSFAPLDLYFKIAVNIVAAALLIAFGRQLRRSGTFGSIPTEIQS